MQTPVLFANAATDIATQFGLDTPHFVAQVISFCLVAGALYKFAYHPVLKMLAERRQRIADSLANADKIKAELAKTEAARLDILNKANSQANKLIEEARAAAARVQEQETQKAIRQAEDIIAKAQQAATAEHARMLADLRREVGRLVVATTGKVTGKILSVEDQRRLAEDTAKELAA